MTRYNVHLPEPLLVALREKAKQSDMKPAEIIRLALAEYLKK